MGTTPLQQLAEYGQAVWIDYLSRPFVKDGDLEGLIREGIVGANNDVWGYADLYRTVHVATQAVAHVCVDTVACERRRYRKSNP